MVALVTGGLGFVGSNLVDRLVKDGHEVYVIDDLSSQSSSEKYKNQRAQYSINDINREVFPNVQLDVIFHLAALARIQPSFEIPHKYYETNSTGTWKICQWAAESGATVVYSSTSSKNHDDGKYLTPYTYTKVLGEEHLKMWGNLYGLKSVVTNFYNVYGPREPREGEWATVVAKFLRQRKSGEKLTVVGDGNQMRDFTHVEDIVEGLIKAVDYAKVDSPSLELGRGFPIRILDLAKMISENDQSLIEHVPLRKNEGHFTLAPVNDTFEKIGWKPSRNLPEYISNELDSWKNYKK